MSGKSNILTPREFLAMRMWRRGKTMAEIGATFGITRQGAQKMVKRAKSKLIDHGVDLDDWMLVSEVVDGE